MTTDWECEEYTGDEDIDVLLKKHKVTEVECENCHMKFRTFEGIENHIVITNHHLSETYDSLSKKLKEIKKLGHKSIIKIHAVGDLPNRPNLSWFELYRKDDD